MNEKPLNPSELLSLYMGKSDEEGWFHSILHHSLDAAAAASAWLEASPSILGRLSLSGKVSAGHILFFIFLHDIGKICWKYQRYNPVLWKEHFGISDNDVSEEADTFYDHGDNGRGKDACGGPFLYEFAELNPFKDSADGSDPLWNEWCRAVLSHHDRYGDFGSSGRYLCFREEGRRRRNPVRLRIEARDREARRAFFEFGRKMFLRNGESLLPEDRPSVFFRGFCSVCDWIASNRRVAKEAPSCGDPAVYFEEVKKKIQGILPNFGLTGEAPALTGFSGMFPGYSPRGIQAADMGRGNKNTLIIAEASTGSGKTEFALCEAARIMEEGNADGIVFALPTQATANALFDRVTEWAGRVFPSSPQIVLAHGKSSFHGGFMEAVGRGYEMSAQQGDFLPGSPEVYCPSWIASGKKRSLLGRIVICTVDQVLKSALPIRHGSVYGFAAARSVLIVDEVHSYSPYMSGLLDKVLKELSQAGGSAILLSATLPAKRKRKILSVWSGSSPHPEQESGQAPYPLLTVGPGRRCTGGEGVHSVRRISPSQADPRKDVRIQVRRLPDTLPDKEMAGEIVEAALSGKAVAFICNLVDAAFAVRDIILKTCEEKKVSLPVDFLHSRFLPGHRAEIEDRVMTNFGKGRIPGKGRIIIGTQVLEQSLDLDFDILYTQLCPVDLLFQRMGRLYRHAIGRMDEQGPRCIVLSAPENDFGPHVYVYGNLGGGRRGANTSISLLWRTRSLIETLEKDRDGWGAISFPSVYRDWIDRVYASSFDGECDLSKKGHAEFEDFELASDWNAKTISSLDRRFIDSDDAPVLMTRDGSPSIPVLPVQNRNGELFLFDGLPFRESGLDRGVLREAERASRNSLHVPGSETWEEALKDFRSAGNYRVVPLTESGNGRWVGGPLSYSPSEGFRLRLPEKYKDAGSFFE